MSDFSGALSDTIEQLGQAFLAAFYTPSAIFVLAHLYVLIPIWAGSPLTSSDSASALALPLISDPDLVSLIGVLLIPFFIGMILLTLNDTLIRAFEGKLAWLRKGVLARRAQRYRYLSAERYRTLIALRKKYQEESECLNQASSPDEQRRYARRLRDLRVQIADEHEEIKQKHPPLPLNPERVAPTAFGNIYAQAEEYSHQRYGIDSVLFWSRLRILMDEEATGHSEQLAQQKTALDMAVNFSCVAALIVLESLLTILFVGYSPVLLILAVTSATLAFSFYQSALNAVSKLGELIRISYDFHRKLILNVFGLEMPANPAAERLLWAELALFIRGGDSFYFPAKAEGEKKDSVSVNPTVISKSDAPVLPKSAPETKPD